MRTKILGILTGIALLNACSSGGGGDAPGSAGTNGASGTNGAAGTNATAGTNGAAGTNAAAGTNGAAGTIGVAGTNGAAGTNAMAGTSGNAGTTGAAGTTSAGGTTGAAGRGGTTGAAGTVATGGTTGAAGRGGSTGTAGTSGGAGSTGTQHWVGTWTASPYLDSGNPPPTSLANSVLRQVTHVSLGGSQIRVQLSNIVGNAPVTINAAHIALCKATPAVDSTIDTATDKALAFGGTASVTIAAGKEIWSDPIDFALPATGNLTITLALGSVPSNLTAHSGSRTTSYIQSGSNVTAASMTSASTTEHWWFISGIDVMADASARGVVAIGDSITDGRGTDTNRNNRWTDVLAARLLANAATTNVSMMNQGIGATNLVGTSGTAAQARFARDVLGQSGVKYAIVLDGVNDIGGGASFASLKAAYDDLIAKAHARNVLIYGATITPFGGYASYYSAAHESVRQQVNTYIKSGVFDGYIDFDAALTDGGNPPKLQATYEAWSQMDGLHPGPTGYAKMGQTPDLTLFTK